MRYLGRLGFKTAALDASQGLDSSAPDSSTSDSGSDEQDSSVPAEDAGRPIEPVCGDGICSSSEDMDTCPVDCGGFCECDVDFECTPGCDCDEECTGGLCSETCDFSGDGECDDGGPGSTTSVCDLGGLWTTSLE